MGVDRAPTRVLFCFACGSRIGRVRGELLELLPAAESFTVNGTAYSIICKCGGGALLSRKTSGVTRQTKRLPSVID